MTESGSQKKDHDQKEIWAARIKECQESGQTVRSWCEEHSVSYNTFRKWRHKLSSKDAEEAEFYEISTTETGRGTAVTVHAGLYRVDVYRGADEQTVSAVLKALKTC